MLKTNPLALRDKAQRYQLLVDAIRDSAVFALSIDGVIETWNKGAQALTGYSPDEAIGKNFSMLCPPEQLEASNLRDKLDWLCKKVT